MFLSESKRHYKFCILFISLHSNNKAKEIATAEEHLYRPSSNLWTEEQQYQEWTWKISTMLKS